jgi:hypothetical protein
MRTIALYLAFSFFFALSASGERIWGHSTIDIDPSTSTVTATCSTEVDTIAEGAYSSDVYCTVTDGSGNVIDSEEGSDDGTGYAESTITFTGTPGETYYVTGSHTAMAYLDYGEYYDEPILRGWADDPFNFSSFAENPGNYPDDFSLEGPGPEQQIRRRFLLTAETHVQENYSHATISIKFVGNKTTDDLLWFENSPKNCSEFLGLQNCSGTGWWLWSIEASYSVSDDASRWSVVQTASPVQETGTDYDSNHNLRSFSISSGGGLDGPQSTFLQSIPGTKTGYWIDSPGLLAGVAPDGGTIVNEDWVQNYSVQVCSTMMSGVCSSASWQVHLVITNGVLSASSSAGNVSN